MEVHAYLNADSYLGSNLACLLWRMRPLRLAVLGSWPKSGLPARHSWSASPNFQHVTEIRTCRVQQLRMTTSCLYVKNFPNKQGRHVTVARNTVVGALLKKILLLYGPTEVQLPELHSFGSGFLEINFLYCTAIPGMYLVEKTEYQI